MNFKNLKITTTGLILCVVSAFANPTQNNFFDFKKAKLANETKGITSVIVVFNEEVSGVRCQVSGKTTIFKEGIIQNLKPVIPENSAAAKRMMSSQKLSRAARNMRNMYSADIEKSASIIEILEKLNAMPEVKYAEPNYAIHLCEQAKTKITSPLIPLQRGNSTFRPSNLPTFQRHQRWPDDPFYNLQWDLNNTGQTYPKAFNSGTASGIPGADISWQSAYETGMPTAEIIVGVIDTGVDYYHRDLTNQMWRNVDEIPGNGIDDDFNGYVDDVYGINVAYGTGDPMDDHGHGTHVSGIIAAEANNNYGICGVNPNAKIMGLKIFSSTGAGSTFNAVECVIYGASMGAKVLNCSWGGGAYLQSLVDAFDFANELGCAIICASGNNASLLSMLPASYHNTISVTASDSDDLHAGFANYGPWVDVMAPGEDILSLKAELANIAAYSNDFLVMNGTSMACPAAAGVLSLLMASNPGHHPFLYKNALKESCDDIYNIGENTNFVGMLGSGRVNIIKTLAYDETNAFIEARLETGPNNDSQVAPGGSAKLFTTVGLWQHDMDNLSIRLIDKTPGIKFPNGSTYNLGNMLGYSVTNLPDETFIVKVNNDTEYGSTESFIIQLIQGSEVIDQKKIYVQVFSTDFSRFVVADIDNDGIKEVLGATGRILYCFDSSALLKWVCELPFDSQNTVSDISVGDFNGNGTNEITIAIRGMLGYGKIHFVYGDGTYWKTIADMVQFYSLNVEDLNYDGRDDVIAQGHNGGRILRAYDVYAGSILWSLPSGIETSMPAVGDIDGDGFREIVYYEFPGDEEDDYAFLRVMDFAGNEISKYCYTVDFFERFVGFPSLGDFDGNGTLDVLATDSYSKGKNSVIFDIVKGETFPGYPRKFEVDNRANVIADLDDDGDLEIIGVDSEGYALRAFHHDGSPVEGYPISVPDIASIVSPVVADVDGDYKQDIVYLTLPIANGDGTESYTVVARDASGLLVQAFPKEITQPEQDHGNIFVVAVDWLEPNFEGTDPELIVFSAVEDGVHTYSPGSSFSEFANDWSTARHDWRHSSCYQFNSVTLAVKFFCTNRYGTGTLSTDFRSEVFGKDKTGLQYFWDFDNNGTTDSTNANPAYSFSEGIFSVALTVSNATGEGFTVLKNDFIEVYPASGLVADFSATPVSGDAPITVSFTDQSLYRPEEWEWDFNNDGTIDSTVQNPSFLYTNSGSFFVKLTVKNNLNGTASSNTIIKSNFINLGSLINNVTNHYVSPQGSHIFPYKNWNEAATNIQTAVNVATPGHNVIVGNGVYPRFDSVYDDVVIRSENGPEVTIVDAKVKSNCMYFYHDIILDGLTFRNGIAGSGGAISAYGCTGVVKNCIFHNNQTEYYHMFIGLGGAIRVGYQTAPNPTHLFIQDSIFYSNSALVTAGCILDGSESSMKISRCTFFDNRSKFYGTAISGGPADVDNSLFYGNSGDMVIHTLGKVDNCTIVDNTSDAGALNTSAAIRNNIVYNNEGGNIRQYYTNSTVYIINNCATPAGIAGSGNITNNPQFVNSALNDYRVFGTSQCVDGGSNYHERVIQSVETVLVDFGVPEKTTPGNWNNITDYQDGFTLLNAIDTNGAPSGYSISVSNFYGTVNCEAVCSGSPFPPLAEQDGFVALNWKTNGAFIFIDGLDPSGVYDLTFFGIVTNPFSKGEVYFDINDEFADIYNRSRTNYYDGRTRTVVGPTDGKIKIKVWNYSSNCDPSIGLIAINKMEYVPTGPVVPSLQLDLQSTNRIFNEIVDIGAYEFTGSLAPVAIAEKASIESRMNHSIPFSGRNSYDPDGTIVNYAWNFDDGFTTNGAALTNVTYNFSIPDFRLVTLTVTDDSGQKGADTINLYVLPEVPNAPTELTASNDAAKSVDVTWIDNADDEEGFSIQRYTLDYPRIEIIVDDDSDKIVYEAGGDWRTKSSSTAYKGSFHYITETKTIDKNAYLNPELPENGIYEMFIRWPHEMQMPDILGSTNFAEMASIYAFFPDGEQTLTYNTRINGNQWNSLGAFKMNPDTHFIIALPYSDTTVPIDAFKFVQISEFVTIGAAQANTTNFIDTNVEQGKTYTYKCYATNSFGSSLPSNDDTVNIDYTNQPPVASIDSVDPTSANFQALVSASGSGIDSDGEITSYKWNFGDGYSGSVMEGAALSNVSYTYRHIGNYTVSLTVYDNEGRASTNFAVVSVSINGAIPAPTTNLVAVLSGENADAIALSWEGNMVHEDGFNIQRKVGSGNFVDLASTAKGIKYYSDSDIQHGETYTYIVRSYNQYGASDWSNEDSVYVPILPEANILSPNAPTSDVPNLVINFLGEAIAGDNTITNLQWNFGDGSINTNSGLHLTNVVHTYIAEGMYTAVFSVADSGGFGAEDSVQIEVIPEPGIVWIFGLLELWIIGRKRKKFISIV